MIEDETIIEDQLGEGDDQEEVIPYRYSITSYGADYTVDSLVKRMSANDIYVPLFQRSYVWTLPEASRFVESLLLGLPVPGIFLTKEQETQKMLVLDGQQRLRTLQYFYEGIFRPTGREFALAGVQPQFANATYKTIADDDRRRLDDSILHATVVRQDQPSNDESSIYLIFERINTAGRRLHPQELRTCIYQGEFVNTLARLNENDAWREIFGKISKNMRDRELILRFLALYFDHEGYSKPMKGFLNEYMAKNRHLKMQTDGELEHAFAPTVEAIRDSIGKNAFKPKRALNAAVFDAVMVGVARRLTRGSLVKSATLNQQYKLLLEEATFNDAVTTSTADEERVRTRLDMATTAFAEIP